VIYTRVLAGDAGLTVDLGPDELRAAIGSGSGVVWVDLEAPTADELALAAGMFNWDQLTVADIAKQGQRAKLEQFDAYRYLVMHVLTYAGSPAKLEHQQVDFLIGANYVATVHYDDVPHIAHHRDQMHQLEPTLGRGRDFLLYVLTDELVDSYFPVLDAMHEAVDALEDESVASPSPQLMTRIFD
jgi:magnesium transporter